MYSTLLCIAAIVIALYRYYRQAYTRFSRYGVKHIIPIPPFGNMTKIVLKMEHVAHAVERDYRSFPEERFVGRYEFTKRQLLIRDLELIKKITVKNFEDFLNHRFCIDQESDPVIARVLMFFKDKEWKDMRSSISPAFTSSKIRLMVPFMVEVGEQMIKDLKKKSQESKSGYIDVDVKDMTTRYATDVIASCAFGLKVDSFMDVDNNFYANIKAASSINFKQLLKFFGYSSALKLMRLLKISLFSESLNNYFRHLVMSTMLDREKRNIVRYDMIHQLMEAKKGRLTHEKKTIKDVDAGFATVEESNVGKNVINKEWSDDEIVAQAVTFVIGGFEVVSSAMSFLLHELALNPDVQEKLYQDIMENETKNGGKFDYTSIQQMIYLDMVVSESLRLWPPAISMDRICNKDYNCGKPNDKAKEDFILRKGDNIVIPVWGIHRDPQYFPDPLKFDPERFSDENKHKIHPFSYMPFGLGPRNCIGSRFALCMVKVMAYQLLKEMELSPSAKTCLPAELSTDAFFIKLKGGHWVRMTPRN